MDVPARQAYSHWASVGSVNSWPLVAESQRQKAMAASQVTRTTGWAGLFEGFAERDALIAFAFATNALFLVLNLILGLIFLPRAMTLLREMRRQRKAGETVRQPILHDPVDN